MTKTIHILLLCAFLPMIGMAREETLEERKARIVRKYLRERMDITQSDMVVPTDLPEDELVTDSEKFREQDGSILRQEEGMASPLPPRVRPQPVPRVNSNWLLSDEEENADEFSKSSDPYGSSLGNADDANWSLWEDGSSTRTTADSSRRDSRYDPYTSQDSRRGMMDGRTEQSSTSIFGRRSDSTYSGSSFSSRTDTFSPSQERSTYYNSSLNLQGNQAKIYGSDPSEGLLTTPFGSTPSSSADRQSPSNYQPYKSPYAQDRERRQQQGTVPATSSQDFSRPGTYEQWKDKNKGWDPTQDDAFINGMMPNSKR
jgi:hypothetical protein